MFYSTELLSLRRKGKLARCWLAATVSEKMFKKVCRPNLIQKIDVYHTCQEILLTIQIRNSMNYGRFSLYLSSQLMYGATKILFYQTKLFQDYLFNAYGKLIKINRPEKDSNVAKALELPNMPAMHEVFRNVETSSNLYLIAEEPYTSVIGYMMQDALNFGILSNNEVEKFLLPEGEQQSLNEIRKFPGDDSEVAEILQVQVPLVNVNQFEMDTIEIEKETRLSFTRRDQQESLIAVEDDQLNRHASTMSRKRALKSSDEMPSKRRKVSPEEKTIPAPEPEPILEPIPVPEVTAGPTHETEQQQVLSALENRELIEVTKPRRKQKFYDAYTKLSDAVMQKWIHNITAHTIQDHRFTTILPSAKEYLTQPSTIVFNGPWGKILNKFFKQYLVVPLVAENEFQVVDFDIEDTMAGDTIRADVSSKLRDQTAELSSQIAITSTKTTDQSKMLEKILPANDYQPKEIEEFQEKETKEHVESIVGLPEITDIEEKNGELSEKLEKSSNGKKSKSSSFSSEVRLIKPEMIALMEVQWHEKRLINFHELISLENYCKRDAARAFYLCLELQAEKAVILKQADPFSTIWIEKYPCYSSGTDEDTVIT